MTTSIVQHNGREFVMVELEDFERLIEARDAGEHVAQRILAGATFQTKFGDLALVPSKNCRRCHGEKPKKRGQRYCAACAKISRIESVAKFWTRRKGGESAHQANQ
jgi:PHP family Zn ribbon phosphoesterase